MKRPPRELVREWYGKAAEAGLHDIEIPTASGNMDGRMRTTVRTDAGSLLVREGEERAEYFRRARAFVHEHRWRTRGERRIWAMHANGATVEEIERAVELPHARVQRTIERLAAIMRNPERRGRPHEPHGRGRDAYQTPGVRLSATEADAFVFLMAHLGLNPTDTLRLCIRAQALIVAGRICARTEVDTCVPGKEGTKR